MHPLSGLLPLVPLLTLTLLLRPHSADWRQAGIRAAVVLGLLVVGTTEALSAVGRFAGPGLLAVWSALAVVCLVAAAVRFRAVRPFLRGRDVLPRGVVDAALAVAIVAVLAAALITGLVSAPTTWDSMTYHLPRVMHWLARGDVGFYPTTTDRQLYSGPLAGYLVALLHALTGDDHRSSLPQWFAAAGCALGASRITALLGGSARAQLVSALAVVTLPALVLEATTTQNDVVTAFWVVAVVGAALETPRTAIGAWAVLDIGAAAGLAVLSKATAVLVLVPFAAWWAVRQVRARPRRAVAWGVLVATVAVAVNAGQFARNLDTFGRPLGPAASFQLTSNAELGPGVLLAGVVRNTATNLAFPDDGWNERVTEDVHDLLGWFGVSADDPDTTFPRSRFEVRWKLHEDFATNIAHLLLLLTGLVVLLARPRRDTAQRGYAVALVVAFVVFSGYLRWQPWITRLMIPLFVLGAPVIGLLLTASVGDAARAAARALPVRIVTSTLAAACVGLLVYVGVYASCFSVPRPWWGEESIFETSRFDQRMAPRPNLMRLYRLAAADATAAGARRVGVVRSSNEWEYPLWVLFDAPGSGVRIYDLDPHPATAAGHRLPPPDAVICVDKTLPACADWTGPGWTVRARGPVVVSLRRG